MKRNVGTIHKVRLPHSHRPFRVCFFLLLYFWVCVMCVHILLARSYCAPFLLSMCAQLYQVSLRCRLLQTRVYQYIRIRVLSVRRRPASVLEWIAIVCELLQCMEIKNADCRRGLLSFITIFLFFFFRSLVWISKRTIFTVVTNISKCWDCDFILQLIHFVLCWEYELFQFETLSFAFHNQNM